MFNNNQPLFDVKATPNNNVRTTTCANSLNVLTKTSDDVTIKSYFEGVHELLKSKGSDAFCVNLDEVWPLVYGRKDVAVRALTNDYFEGVDYTTQVSDNQTLRLNVEQDSKGSWGGSNKVTYFLTVSCLDGGIEYISEDALWRNLYRQSKQYYKDLEVKKIINSTTALF